MSNSHLFAMGDDVFKELNTGTEAAPSWAEMPYAGNFNADPSKGEFEFTLDDIMSKLSRGTKMEIPISFDYYRPDDVSADAIFLALRDSFWTGKPVQIAWTDKGVADANSRGFKAWVEVMKMSHPKKTEEGVMHTFEAKPTDYIEGGTLYTVEKIQPA